ncbi:methyltransferase-like protein 27 [Oreochromis aureus]|nr:methyltransferase-like protein 27 [Oreochromis aureus]
MFDLGFRHFVGVDGSEGMLEKAEKTGLYQDLKLVLLGPQPLPVQTDVFDVVTIVGALDAGFVPVSAVRELCRAAKPGGFVCLMRGNHRGAPAASYKKDLETELQQMEEEGLWSRVAIQEVDRYMEDPHLNIERDGKTEQQVSYISGNVYFYKKSVSP